nr:hypothetical protein [Tanacetum cinerariifolium]
MSSGMDRDLKKIDKIMANLEGDCFGGMAEECQCFLDVQELDSVKLALDLDLTNYELHEEEAAYFKAFNEASRVEELFLKQKAKVDLLKLGDANTAYFHKVVNIQTSCNRIDSMMLPNGECTTGDQVLAVFVDHYTHFLGQQGTTGPLDTTELFRNTLSKEVAA